MVSNSNSDCGLVDLGQYTTTDIDEEVEIEINTETMYIKDTGVLKDFNWPINVGDDVNTDALMVVGDKTFQEDSRLGLRRWLVMSLMLILWDLDERLFLRA